MWAIALEWFSAFCLLSGALLIVTGGIGLLRFPDFFTRMHAAGVTETLAGGLILLGLMCLAGWGIVLVKLVLILLFILITSPTACHALAKSALHGKLAPVLDKSSSSDSVTPVRDKSQ